MKIANQKTNRLFQILPYLLLFLGSTIFFYGFVSYVFFHQEKSSLFLVSSQFLADHLDQPGGFLEYLGKLLTTFYYHKLAGSVLMSLIILGTVFFLSRIGKEISGKSAFVLPFLVGALMVILQTNYQYAAFNNTGIFLQLLFYYLTIKFLKGKLEWITVALFPLWYFLTGGFSWIFLLLFMMRLAVKRENLWWVKIIVIFLLSAISVYFSMEFFFFETPETLLQFPFTIQEIGGQIQIFAVLVFIVLSSPLVFGIVQNRNKKISFRTQKWLQLSPFIVLIGLGGALIFRVDKKNSHYFRAEELFYEQQYEKLIAFNTASPSNNILTNYLNNIALAETGQLTSRLFEFPQSPDGSTLFLEWEIVGEVLRRGGYFYYTVGMVNEANRWAYEYMVMRGFTPEVLKMLIKTELINGNYRVAEKYISILKKSIYYRSEARNFEKLLFDDEAVNADPELGEKKRLKPKVDFFVQSDNPAANLELLVSTDTTNFYALEYQFAWLLLQKDVQSVGRNLPLLEKFGYRQMPRHIQEAAAGYKLLQMGPFPELEYLEIDPRIEQRFRQYYQTFQQNSSSKERAQRALYPNFHETFWYYLFFN
jgi:hypothetical protein